ncbi:hypothetical protein C8J57DRAFT_1251788 [Mycena rebaudengoi]|nr:hypothetical protein C8J57DRAFT_1251788 [Mycena rebaudengoi]
MSSIPDDEVHSTPSLAESTSSLAESTSPEAVVALDHVSPTLNVHDNPTPAATFSFIGSAAIVFATCSVAAQVFVLFPDNSNSTGGGGIRLSGPWVVGQLYGVVPLGPLAAISHESDKWYAITKGKYVGVTTSTAIADGAVSHVSHALRTVYSTQEEARQAFNSALSLGIGLVIVIAPNV